MSEEKLGMITLDELELLIKIRKENYSGTENQLTTLLEGNWIVKSDYGYKLTPYAETRLHSVLQMFVPDQLDPKVIENYENQISYEIKRNSKEFIKTKQIRIKLLARPEIMGELVNRYIDAGWDATHQNGTLSLKWKKKVRQ